MSEHGGREEGRAVTSFERTAVFLTLALDFLDSPRARRYWSGWKGVRNLIAYSIWWFRFRNHAANRKP